MRNEGLFRTSFGINILVIGLLEIISIFLFPNVVVSLCTIILLAFLLVTFRLGMRMRCQDVWMLYHDSVVSQRNSLVWYVSNAMHAFNPPFYQLMLTESFYDKGKTLHTELAKLESIAREESRTELISEIQGHLEQWETILNQLRNRIDQLDATQKL